MHPSEIEIVTAVTGGRDALREDQIRTRTTYIAYTDQPVQSDIWSVRPACGDFRSPRRNARVHKLLIHYYAQSAYSIWMDASIALRIPPEDAIEKWLDGADIATFPHRTRNCAYEEAKVCLDRGLDAPERICAQMARYRRDGFPVQHGLAETSVVLRRHSRAVETFNDLWWSELSFYSVRDQLSFNYVIWRLGLKVNYITPSRFDCSAFHCDARPPTGETERGRIEH
jgi:hypothetical protein